MVRHLPILKELDIHYPFYFSPLHVGDDSWDSYVTIIVPVLELRTAEHYAWTALVIVVIGQVMWR